MNTESTIQVQFATLTNARLNKALLIKNTRDKLGLNDTPSDWTVEQKALYSRNLSDFIVTHASSFTEDDYKIANRFLGQGPYYTPEQIGYVGNVETFVNAFGANATNILPAIGVGGAAVLLGILGLLVVVGLLEYKPRTTT